MASSTEEPERKRRHLQHSPALKKQASFPSSEEKKVDVGMLQYQNQKLEQQLDVQRCEIEGLESKCSQLQNKQISHKSSLEAVGNAWSLLNGRLNTLVERGCSQSKDKRSGCSVSVKDRTYETQHEAFIQRLRETGATDSSGGSNNIVIPAEVNLRPHKDSAFRTVQHLVRAVDNQRIRKLEFYNEIQQRFPKNGGQMDTTLDNVKDTLLSLWSDLDSAHLRHHTVASLVRLWRKNILQDQSEIKIVSGDLSETIMDLENIRQKITALRNQNDRSSGGPTCLPGETCDRFEDKSFRNIKHLESALEDAKTILSQRSIEAVEAKREKIRLADQLQQMKDLHNDKRYVTSSPMYTLLLEQVTAVKEELEQCQSIRNTLLSRMENIPKCHQDTGQVAKCYEAIQKQDDVTYEKLDELESRLFDVMTERDNLQVRLDEACHVLDREDEVAEFKVMISTLEKEAFMMQQQLDRCKEAACAAESLRTEAESLNLLLEKKTNEWKFFKDKIASQTMEVKSLKEEKRRLRESEQELQLILDMCGSESTDSRSIEELKEAENFALAEVERFKSALDDHGLELRVKVANEAEAACQQRLAAAEVELSELRERLDSSERVIMELNEAAKMKNEEHDAYLSEIETIGQAYEDMQTQNQRLLQQISKRDEYNIKLVSDSVKTKQLFMSLNEEKRHLSDHIQQVMLMTDSQRQRVSSLEEQVKSNLNQFGKVIAEERETYSALGAFKRNAADVEKELFSAKACLEVAQRELHQRKAKTEEIRSRIEKERLAKKKAQEEVNILRSKVSDNDVKGPALIAKLQEELKEYKAILKCSVCHDRPKEVIITKCCHLFCSQCIQKNLEIRHRKCPGCGVTFGQNDVRNVYI